MSILRDLLLPLQEQFSDTQQGKKRSAFFAYTMLSIMIPFTSSVTSNLLRSLNTLFGLNIVSQRFYSFMASTTLPWERLWQAVWRAIPKPLTDGRLLLALDDSINPKTGKTIFGCGHFHNHAVKANQSSYVWSQCILAIGLLKPVKSRWVFFPLAHRFYMMEKDIQAKKINTRNQGKTPGFESKMMQAAIMIDNLQHFFTAPALIIADSWFGNDGLWKRLGRGREGDFNLLSRLRINITLYDEPESPIATQPKPRGRRKKYGKRAGNVDECAQLHRDKAQSYSVFLYGRQREVRAYSQICMLKTLKCPVRVVWVYRKTRYLALFTTDLALTVEQIIEYYGARWKIEAGFKEIKQEIGSAKAQVRKASSVLNHLNFCTMATSLIWIYADRLENAPERRYKIRGRSSFAFSDVRKIIAEEALSQNFQSICPSQLPHKSFISSLLRMVA